MLFEFTVSVEVERTQGKFASRDELAGQILEELESADPGTLSADEGGEYETTNWVIEEVPQKRKPRKNAVPKCCGQPMKLEPEQWACQRWPSHTKPATK